MKMTMTHVTSLEEFLLERVHELILLSGEALYYEKHNMLIY